MQKEGILKIYLESRNRGIAFWKICEEEARRFHILFKKHLGTLHKAGSKYEVVAENNLYETDLCLIFTNK